MNISKYRKNMQNCRFAKNNPRDIAFFLWHNPFNLILLLLFFLLPITSYCFDSEGSF